MKKLLLLACFYSSVAFAQSAKVKPNVDSVTKQKIIAAINYNFDACNREDIEDVMDSCADAMPRREEFRAETLRVFKEKDIHYSLMDVEVLEIKGDFALVRMVQKSHTENRDTTNYRNQTALVTEEECVEYLNTLRREKGVWKLHVIVSEIKPVSFSEKANEDKEDCAGGKCSTCRPTPFDIPGTLSRHGFKPPSR